MRGLLRMVALATALTSGLAQAATYHVAPLGQVLSCTPDGSQACPFASVAAAFDSGRIVGGDTVLLMDGDHAGIRLSLRSYASEVLVKAQHAGKARVEFIAAEDGTRNLRFKNLNVWFTNPRAPTRPLLYSARSSQQITFDSIDARGGADAASYLNWGLGEWRARAVDGAILEGPGSVVRNSRFTGVHLGIALYGAETKALNNLIDGHSADGIRGDGDGARIIGNRIVNCVSIDDNHADGIQSVATQGPTVDRLHIEANTIIEWTNAQSSPLRCALQGIGMFDGPYIDTTIVNNLVSVSLYHGISLYGADGALIANNTVVHIDGVPNGFPWIGLFAGKDGTASRNVVIANNLAMLFEGAASAALNVQFIKNSVIKNPARLFENVAAFDYRPLPGTAFVDSANPKHAPSTDILGAPRPAGLGPDRGAYEIGALAAASP